MYMYISLSLSLYIYVYIERERERERHSTYTILQYEDSFIADLVVGLRTGQIKTGAPCRSEHLANT